MNRSSAKINPFLRFAAAGLLLVWLTAVTACSSGCLGEDSHSDPAHMMQAAGTGSQSHDSDKHDGHDDSFCVSLHSLCLTSSGPALITPDFGLAFTFNFVSTVELTTLKQPGTPVLCQPPDGNRVSTPEVCLGPAFRSLAPPVLA